MAFKNPIEQAQSLALKPRDDEFNKKMSDFHAQRKALLDSKDPDAYLGPKWNALSDEIRKFRSGYEPSKIDSPREYLLDNDLDEFQIDQVRDDIDFKGLWDAMQKGDDFYKVASVNGDGFDSAVREKIFDAMATKLGLQYDDIYNQWLGRPKGTPSAIDNGNPNAKPYQSKFKVKYPDRYAKVRSHKTLANLSDEDIDGFARDLGIDLD